MPDVPAVPETDQAPDAEVAAPPVEAPDAPEAVEVAAPPVEALSHDELVLFGVDPDGPAIPTEATKARKYPALVLTLGGAPASPHLLEGLPGLYRPDVATVIGGPGEPSLQQAEAVLAVPGVPLALVYLTAKGVTEAREAAAADLALLRGELQGRRADAVGGEGEYVADNIQAAKGA